MTLPFLVRQGIKMRFEMILVALALACAILPVLGEIRYGRWISFAGAAIVVLIAASIQASLDQPQSALEQEIIKRRPIEASGDGYVSSKTCRACHPHNYETWHASYHRTMTQVATPETVIGDFNDVELQLGEQSFRLLRAGKKFAIADTSAQADASNQQQTNLALVAMTTGSHHMQLYWCPSDKSRITWLLPFAYLRDEQRWVPRDSIFLKPPSQEWGSEAGRWNTGCIGCHATHGQPRHTGPVEMDTHVGEFGISCEACHGPGQDHVLQNRNPLRRYQHHLGDQRDTTIIQPEHLTARRSSQVCGQCHGIHVFPDRDARRDWHNDGYKYRPGDELADTRVTAQMSRISEEPRLQERATGDPHFVEDRFWSDGMVRVSGREYNGLVESPCYQGGDFSCLSCHQMHKSADDPRSLQEWANDQLKTTMGGDQACLQCHASLGENLTQHTHHPPESTGSRCYNCHMPYTTYGLLKAIRSHQVDSPSVTVSVETGRPNACNQCHLDKTLAWTANHLTDWYGTPQPELSDDQKDVAASVLWLLSGDAGQRAVMAWSMGWPAAREAAGSEWLPPYLAQLLVDPYDAVRFIAYRSLREIPEFADFQYDFVDSPEARQEARWQAMDIWHHHRNTTGRGPDQAILLNSSGALDQERFEQLVQKRDVRRVWLKE